MMLFVVEPLSLHGSLRILARLPEPTFGLVEWLHQIHLSLRSPFWGLSRGSWNATVRVRRMITSLSFSHHGPFDLPLSLMAEASFLPPLPHSPRSLKLAVRVSGHPAIIEICQRSKVPAVIAASANISIPRSQLTELAQRLTACDLDLRRFYRIAARDPIMGPIAKQLHGFKPLRPPSLFEMAVIAITEQQLSIAAAFHIRSRLVRRFGTPIEDLWVFPTPEVLAEASLHDLALCGLSNRKAESNTSRNRLPRANWRSKH
jgi:hypothetical protein